MEVYQYRYRTAVQLYSCRSKFAEIGIMDTGTVQLYMYMCGAPLARRAIGETHMFFTIQT